MSSEEADRVLRAEYWADVRGVAEDLKERLAKGEFSDRDEFIEALDQDVDGHQRIIYARQAQECLLFSDNDGAYIDEFGAEGVVEDGSLMWSRLAYAAFRADIVDYFDSIGVDVNDPIPEPDEPEEIDG